MGDLFEYGLLPRLKGLYRQDYSKHSNYGDEKEETAFDAVLLTHAHLDHAAYIHYLRLDIPIYCTEATRLIMQALEDTGSDEQYLTFKESFKLYLNKNGELSRATSEKNRLEVPRPIKLIESSKKFTIDSIEVEPLDVDHSIPGVSGFILHTSRGSILTPRTSGFMVGGSQTANISWRGAPADLDYLLCEGTRIAETNSKTELDVESEVAK